MKIELLGHAQDMRTGTKVVYAKITVADYLELVGDDFDSFSIQRKQENNGKAYERLRKDAKNGALLPSITLAVKPHLVDGIVENLDDNNALASALSVPGQVSILDGLQRTYILKDISSEVDFSFKEGQTLLVEFWLEKQLENLIYRIIVLNAGQKPMSMRHQIDVLFSTFKGHFESRIDGLELFVERTGGRRSRPRKYALDKVVASYQSFIGKSPEIQRENIIAQQLQDEELLAASEDELSLRLAQYIKYLEYYAKFDDEMCRVYPQTVDVEIPDGSSKVQVQIPSGLIWLGTENVMNSFFAAVSRLEKPERVDVALDSLITVLKGASPSSDPLGLQTLRRIEGGINVRKVNVGVEQRRIIFTAFREFFRDEGDTALKDCWLGAAD